MVISPRGGYALASLPSQGQQQRRVEGQTVCFLSVWQYHTRKSHHMQYSYSDSHPRAWRGDSQNIRGSGTIAIVNLPGGFQWESTHGFLLRLRRASILFMPP